MLSKHVQIEKIRLLSANSIVKTLCTTAQNVLPPNKEKEVNQIWKDDETFNELINARGNEQQGTEKYKELTKCIKKRVRKLRNEKLASEAREINARSSQKEIEKLYRSFKNDGSTFVDKKMKAGCDPQKLKDYFKNHFNVPLTLNEPKEITNNAPNFITKLQAIGIDYINTEPPAMEEIELVVKSQKGGKSGYYLPTEYLTRAIECENIMKDLVTVFNNIWKTGTVPNSWCHTKLKTIWKGAAKGKITNPEAHRGIQIGSTFCKILVTIILKRLQKWYDEQLAEQQQGFRPGRGTAEGIYLLNRLHQIKINLATFYLSIYQQHLIM